MGGRVNRKCFLWKRVVAFILVLSILFMLIPESNGTIQAANENSVQIDVAEGLPAALTPNAFSGFVLKGTVSSDNSSLALRIDFTLADDFLMQQAQLENPEDITFDIPCKLDSAQVNLATSYTGKTLTTSNVDIGAVTYTVSGDVLHVKGSISVSTLAEHSLLSHVIGNATCTLELNNSAGFAVTPSMVVSDEKIAVNMDFEDPADDPGSIPGDYSITKEVVGRTDKTSPYFDYKIEVKASNGSVLNSLKIEDDLPEGLELKSATVGGNLVTLNDSSGAEYIDGTFVYSVPAYDKSDVNKPKIETLTIELKTKLTDTAYGDFLADKNKGKDKRTYTNTACIKKGDNTVKSSKSVTADLIGEFLEKKGSVVGSNGKTFEWTINAHTYFEAGTVYLVDKIEGIDKTHMYVKNTGDSSVSYTVNSQQKSASYKEEPLVSTTGSSMTSPCWEEYAYGSSGFTAQNLSNAIGNKTEAIYYTYDSGDDGLDDTAIMVIPLDASYLNGPLEVKYKTNIVDAYDMSSDVAVPLKNTATMLWDWTESGVGPGPAWRPTFDFSIDKSATPNLTLVQKYGAGYNSSTQIVTWGIDVNHQGVDLTNVVLTDIIDTKVQKLDSIFVGSDQINLGEAGSDTAPFYTVSEPDGDGKITYNIYLGDIDKDTLEKLSIKAKVVAPELLAIQTIKGTEKTIENSISLKSDDEYTDTSKGQQKISNTLITKQALKRNGTVGSEYDFNKHQVRWKVTVNPHHMAIKKGILEDALPIGNILSDTDMISVTREDKSGSKVQKTISKSAFESTESELTFDTDNVLKFSYIKDKGDNEYAKDTLKVDFSEPHDSSVAYTTASYTFDFYTMVEENYRTDTFKSVSTSYDLVNNSKLLGKVVHPDDANNYKEITDATATAKHTVTVPPVVKTGQYHANTIYGDLGNACYASWKIVLNKDAIDMTGATLVDQLKSHFDLVNDSVVIAPASIASDGTETKQAALSSEEAPINIKEGGFEFKIPDAYAKTPLVITFDTLVSSSATQSAMENAVELKWADGSSVATQDKKADGAQSFDEDAFVSANRVPSLIVYKAEKGTTYNKGVPSSVLSGAEFTLTQMEKKNGEWVADAAKSMVKTTSTDGMTKFMYLRRDTMYELQETKAPANYNLDKTKYHIVFLGSKTAADFPEGTTIYSPEEYKLNFTIEDIALRDMTPNVTFTKKSDSGKLLENATFTLDSDLDALPAIYAGSDENGVVKFENILEGTYTIHETIAPEGYEVAADMTCTVSFDGTSYHTEIVGDSITTDPISGDYIVIDKAKRKPIKLTLKDNTENHIEQEDKFEVYTEDKTTLVGYLECVAGEYVLTPLSTNPVNTQGEPYIKKQGDAYEILEGSYAFKSTRSLNGYMDDNSWYTLDTVSGSQGITVYRTPLGSITGTKLDDIDKPLSGAKIGLFPNGTTEFKEANLYNNMSAQSDTDGSFSFKNLPYGTYIVAELEAPAGYRLNTTTSYTVEVDSNTVAISKDIHGDDIVLVNTLVKRSDGLADLTIVKTAEDGVVEGILFRVTSDNGYDKTFTTDNQGEIFITDLTLGNYVVSETATDEMKEKYVIPEDKNIFLTESNAKAEFYNKLQIIVPSPTPVIIPDLLPSLAPALSVDPTPTTSAKKKDNTLSKNDNSKVNSNTDRNVKKDTSKISEIPKTSYETNDDGLRILLVISIICSILCLGSVGYILFRGKRVKKNKVK